MHEQIFIYMHHPQKQVQSTNRAAAKVKKTILMRGGKSSAYIVKNEITTYCLNKILLLYNL